MEILIKSFNRPYYLDRCLGSIRKFCKGVTSIKVLDDGTPEQYLNSIQQKHPEVTIVKSAQFAEKNLAIAGNLANGTEIDGFQIPVKLWKQAVRESTEFFIITEDDVWFTREIDLSALHNCMKTAGSDLIKLGNLGVKTDAARRSDCGKEEILFPDFDLFTAPDFVMEAFFYNRFRFFSLLYRLGKVDLLTIHQYYGLFSILMGMYRKEYWLKLWDGIENRVDEKRQLKNAAMHYRKNKANRNLVGLLGDEAMKTTFQSSATNSYHPYGQDFDVNRFNHILNEAWVSNRLDVFENFPKDFSDGYITGILNENAHPKAKPEAWLSWSADFKKQYRDQGCEVD